MQASILIFLLLTISSTAWTAASPVTLRSFCPLLRFNYIYNKYEINLPVRLPSGRSTAELQVKPDAALANKDSGVTVIGHLGATANPSISLLCSTYQRCQTLRSELLANPQFLQEALSINAIGTNYDSSGSHVTSMEKSQISMNSASLMSPNCDRGWVVFQRRIDNSLSFKQNYQTYRRGFGNPNGNYWMGLENLFMATSVGTSDTMCRLRIETKSISGKLYWGEWSQFQVQDRSTGYKLMVKGVKSGSTIPAHDMQYSSGRQFSTYDRDRDGSSNSCSRYRGYGGNWYNNCCLVNPNGVYPNRKVYREAYMCVYVNGKHTPMIKFKMMYKCYDKVSKSKN